MSGAMIGTRSIPMTTPDFLRIEAGAFRMGAENAPHPEDGEGPARSVHLDTFLIAAHAVSNTQFSTFIEATGYVTTAEAQGWSHVFFLHLSEPDKHSGPLAEAPWWRKVTGANWRAPNAERDALPDHPVVHVSYEDARAYCDWTGMRLPTEAEWERGAQSSNDGPINIWRGDFPNAPTGTPGTVAVQDGVPNPQGLVHACGNTWEWTADGFGRLHSPRDTRNPGGNLASNSKVVKGGSYLCAPSYCARFYPSSRRAEHPEATADHLGFRVAMTPAGSSS